MLDERLYLAQVGDSRAYVLRGDQFVQVTRDQSLVNQLIEAGQLTEEEAETFEHNNIILQALGTSETVQVDLTYVDLRAGDTLMMCSDGLTGMIRDNEIKDVLLAVPEPIDACRELTDRANAAGGHDNITVLVVKFGGTGLKPPSGTDEALAYRKYTLPEDTLSATTRNKRAAEPGPVSEEAKKETRRLRVGHTMMGPPPTAPSDPPPTEPQPQSASAPTDPAPQAPAPPRQSTARARSASETTAMPPQLVGLIVIVSLLVVAAVGVLLLR
jgi:protein phosphatase